MFNSFNRIHRLATLGGVSVAAWFSSQILQKPQSISQNRDQGVSESVMDSSSEHTSMTVNEQAGSEMPMMSKSAPENSAGLVALEEDAENREIESPSSDDDLSPSDVSELHASSSQSPPMESSPFDDPVSTSVTATGEPSIDIFWSVILVLGIVVAGLTIELVIKSKKDSKNNGNVV